ncbi:hypothetical protein BISU_3008 [Bifidobacterium subtile]|uniref:Uncharacterized protein n=1 Tax=Bifidobacterium subtile TaxID=77635 RepID=A0A087EB05_9BIFI|nr:hypothetical protein BISU_3008 [Bifidobacterium subtile]
MAGTVSCSASVSLLRECCRLLLCVLSIHWMIMCLNVVMSGQRRRWLRTFFFWQTEERFHGRVARARARLTHGTTDSDSPAHCNIPA